MDALNPTLAFAALFFGLAGHPHDAAEGPLQQSNTGPALFTTEQIADSSVCPNYAIVIPGGSAGHETFGRGTAGDSAFPAGFGEGSALMAARNSENGLMLDQHSASDGFYPAGDETAAGDVGTLQDMQLEDAIALQDANGCGYLPPEP